MAANGLTIDDLQIQITASASGASRSIRNLAKQVESLNSAGLNSKGLSSIATKLGKIAEQGAKLNEVAHSVAAITKAINKTDLAKATSNLSFADRMKTIVANSASAEDALGGVTVAANELGKSASETSDNVETLNTNIEESGKEVKNTAKEFDKASKGALSNFLASVKRIAMYRAIRSALKFITQAIKEGFEMFSTWDKEQNNYMAGTATNLEKLTEKWTILKGQIGALGGALFNGLAPVINWVVEQLTKLVDLLQMVFRSLQGEYSYYKLIYTAAKATTGQAKELKRVLFGFDELNVLPSASGGGGSLSEGSWAYREVPIDSRFLNSIADASNKLKEFFGISDDGQKTIGLLAGSIGLLLGAKAIGGLISSLPRLISLFKGKNSSLADQTSKVTADATATEGLATQFGSATGKATGLITAITLLGAALLGSKKSAQELNAYTQANPIVVKTAADLGGIKGVATGLAATQTVLNANPLTISLYAPLAAITNAFVEFRNSIQSLFNRNPINIAMKVASGGVVGAGSYIKSLGVANASVGGSKVTAKDVEAQIQQTLLQYESDLWNQGGTLGKAVGTFGGAALITAVTGGIASILTSGGALAEILSLLGIVGAFAGGGVPDTGTLFYAGEAGAEVVANMGHSTGVMNISQMQEAVASGNVEVVNAVYAMANAVVNAVNGKNFDVYMDSQKVGHSVTQYQYNQARRGVTQGAY